MVSEASTGNCLIDTQHNIKHYDCKESEFVSAIFVQKVRRSKCLCTLEYTVILQESGLDLGLNDI